MRLTVATTSSGVYSLSKNLPTVRSNKTEGKPFFRNLALRPNILIIYSILIIYYIF